MLILLAIVLLVIQLVMDRGGAKDLTRSGRPSGMPTRT